MEERERRQQRSKSEGFRYFVVKRANVGRPIIELVRRGLRSGELRYTDAAKLLGVKVGSVNKMLATSEDAESKSGSR